MSDIILSVQVLSGKFLAHSIKFGEPASATFSGAFERLVSGENPSEYKTLVAYQLLVHELNLENLFYRKDDKGANMAEFSPSLEELDLKTGYHVFFIKPEEMATKGLQLEVNGQTWFVDKQTWRIGRADDAKFIFPDLDLTPLLGEYANKVSRKLLILRESEGTWKVDLDPDARSSVFIDGAILQLGKPLNIGNEINVGISADNPYLRIRTIVSANKPSKKHNTIDVLNLLAQVIPDKFTEYKVDSSDSAFSVFARILRQIENSGVTNIDPNEYRVLIAHQLLSPELPFKSLFPGQEGENGLAKDARSNIPTASLEEVNLKSGYYALFVKPGMVSTKLMIDINGKKQLVNKQDYMIGRRDDSKGIVPDVDLSPYLGENVNKVSRQLLIFREVNEKWRVKLHPEARSSVFIDKIRLRHDEEGMEIGDTINIGNFADDPFVRIVTKIVNE